MTKGEFIEAVAERAGLSRSEAAKAVDAVIETVTATLAAGESVSFTGFGVFKTSDRAARTGVNPRTGEAVQIPAGRVARFTAGKNLKDAVAG
jgi:DNA-binding protein HU-beta